MTVVVEQKSRVEQMPLPDDISEMLKRAKEVRMVNSREELIEMALGDEGGDEHIVKYDVPGVGEVKEAVVMRCKNGLAVNYFEPYMRRRDPECMVVADEDPSDKTRFSSRFEQPFADMRSDVMDWLADQKLLVMPFAAGTQKYGYGAVLIAPQNAAFFAVSLSDLQGIYNYEEIPEDFDPRGIILLAPPFRHTHCEGKQVVIHNRRDSYHEVFSLNLYPGPSAKKGVYGMLLSLGELEGWLTAHGSTVEVVTPYDNVVTIMHEGASGGGKSEMLEHVHRERDGRLVLGKNTVTGEKRYLAVNQTCELRPVTDDMALCHPEFQQVGRKLVVTDAEAAWFLRVNHIQHYGVDPSYEYLTIHPPEPIVFLNMQAVPQSTCLLWEHIEDEPGKRCPNPRVILPRRMVPNVVNDPVEVDVRSFGIRTPPCTKEKPTYGIFGLLHYLPPALAWMWRLVAPRGFSNPSITDSMAMSSEGVGSYWPFATGRRVDQANLLLRQICDTPRTRYTLSPNQHVGAWETSFMPQWLAREYMARRGGARFRAEQLKPARCPLLGFTLRNLQVEGTLISHWFLQVETQPEVGEEAYDAGAKQLVDFFAKELSPYMDEADLDPLGRDIIQCCLDGGDVEQFAELIKGE